jgi:cytochrome P450
MYGPAAVNFIRQIASNSFTIGKDVKIPSHYSELHYVNIINHFNENYFKNPCEFKPERWLDECETKMVEQFAFLPFGAG